MSGDICRTRAWVKHSGREPEIYNRDYRPNASPLQVYKIDATGHYMKTPKKLLLISLSAITLSWITAIKLQGIPGAIAQTQLSMRLQHGEGTYTITVPETNTTKSAFGGKLRLYDLHIAKMFEVTYSDCQEIPGAGFRIWDYYAGNGKIGMGSFRITCQLAGEIAKTYGLGKPERIAIEYSQEEAGPPISRTRAIPILDISGNKVDRWINFVQRFRPQ